MLIILKLFKLVCRHDPTNLKALGLRLDAQIQTMHAALRRTSRVFEDNAPIVLEQGAETAMRIDSQASFAGVLS